MLLPGRLALRLREDELERDSEGLPACWGWGSICGWLGASGGGLLTDALLVGRGGVPWAPRCWEAVEGERDGGSPAAGRSGPAGGAAAEWREAEEVGRLPRLERLEGGRAAGREAEGTREAGELPPGTGQDPVASAAAGPVEASGPRRPLAGREPAAAAAAASASRSELLMLLPLRDGSANPGSSTSCRSAKSSSSSPYPLPCPCSAPSAGCPVTLRAVDGREEASRPPAPSTCPLEGRGGAAAAREDPDREGGPSPSAPPYPCPCPYPLEGRAAALCTELALREGGARPASAAGAAARSAPVGTELCTPVTEPRPLEGRARELGCELEREGGSGLCAPAASAAVSMAPTASGGPAREDAVSP